ncbi:hypothetical protein FNV43_RR06230 [Rhamnella rubrinervis]|uniref:Uncharacterized protein n=1 Tax=Rhamnella rubrinervis TaxID=2594499 RepID=A0A8K0HE53_9ROSA|nr:hypothetical protein FNV43_RR06230 [Rhamnella rubrinervis]
MDLQSPLILASNQNAPTHQTHRRSANYVPSIWGDRFLSLPPDSMTVDEKMEQEFEQLRKEVKKMLNAAVNNNCSSSEKLKLIDVIQRLGVSYHFESEIDQILQQIYNHYDDHKHHNFLDGDLYNTALCFRLLRQHGYNISCDVFKKFRNIEGNFMATLENDVQGMLSLYEASHLRVRGEDIFDEALNFTTTHLGLKQSQVNPWLAGQVAQALKQPMRKCLPRIQARHFISVYQDDDSHSEILLDFAKLDFNQLQKMHQGELSEITRWWKGLDFSTSMSFARDRLVECYFWILGVYFEPQYAVGRKLLTKVISITSIMDDIYDVHGTFEELQLLTQAIERWDICCIDHLWPEYMKYFYGALLDVYAEIEQVMTKTGRLDCFHYVKEAMKRQARSYFVEAKWYHENHVPTMDEYMGNAMVSCGYLMLTTTSFIGMGDLVTKEAFDWASRNPKILRSACIISRLMDDVVSSEFEQKRGHVATGVQCYMKEHGVSKEEVHRVFGEQIDDAWKDINQEFLKSTDIPVPFLIRVLNLSRVIDLLYKDEDAYTHVGKSLRDGITSLLIDPLP